MKKEPEKNIEGWYVMRRDLDTYLQEVFRKDIVWQHIAEYIIVKAPYFKDGYLIRKGGLDASWKKICKVFPNAISESSYSRLLTQLESLGFIVRWRVGKITFTKSVLWEKIQDLKVDFSLKNLQVTMPISASHPPENCKSETICNELESKSLEAVVVDSCKSPYQLLQVNDSISATLYENKDINKEEKNPHIHKLEKNKTKSKKEERDMDIRSAITPRVKTMRVKTEKAEKKVKSLSPKKEKDLFPTSKEGWKNPNTLVGAFKNAVEVKHPGVYMGDKAYSWEANREPAAKAIDWVRDEVYRNNNIGEPELRAVLEYWVDWYVSNKISSKFPGKRILLNMQAFYETRAQYYSAKDSNDLLIQRSRQRKTTVTSSGKSIMAAFDGMLNLSQESKKSPVEGFIGLALANKGIVLTCLYLEHKKLVPDVVETVSKVIKETLESFAGKSVMRDIYKETWRHRIPAIAKGLVPFSDWETVFGKLWENVTLLSKEEGTSTDHKKVSDFLDEIVMQRL